MVDNNDTRNGIIMDDLIKSMLKIELHAHLNGSLTTETLLELGSLVYGEKNHEQFKSLCDSFQIDDPDNLSECFKKFKIAHDLTSTKDGLRRATFCVIRDFHADNVIYLELRTTPKQTESMTKVDYLECVLDAIRSCKELYPNIMVKLLPSVDRSQGIESAHDTLKIIKNLLNSNHSYSDIIKGIDFSGNPAVSDFTPFKEIFIEARKLNLKLAFHCGEIDNEDEIQEMLEFGMDRCGHGTFIKGHNFDVLKEKKIPVECCISSNVKCKTVDSYADHHFKELFDIQHPVVICTDDFGVFNTNLSNEFRIIQKHFDLNLINFKQLLVTAIDVSFASEQEKIVLRNSIEQFFANKKNKFEI